MMLKNTKRYFLLAVTVALATCAWAQGAVTLDSCRSMALQNNKELRQTEVKILGASYQRKEAAAAYLPSVDLEASYMYNSRKLSMVAEDQLLPTKSFNLQTQQYDFNLAVNPMTGEPITTPSGQYVPSTVALLPKSALTFNIHNIFAGAITVTQPLYMGGKIKAMNELTRYAEDLARQMRDSRVEDVIYDVDAAYWQVVSLKAKENLAESYLNLVESLDKDVKSMLEQGVATRATLLSVDVKVNEAQVDLTRVRNGVVLSRMLLAQLCGLPVNTVMTLADEGREDFEPTLRPAEVDMEHVYKTRHDLQSLELATRIYEEKANVARSEMMPQVVAIGAFHMTNPNTYNGFENRFAGAFSIGAMVKVPLWHWGGPQNKYKAALTEAMVKRLEIDDAKDKIALQVSQANYRMQEAWKTYEMTRANLEKAEENLRIAQVAFTEGMATTDEVLTAQTAWVKANSENIDAQIDLRMCDVYLSKVTGDLNWNTTH